MEWTVDKVAGCIGRKPAYVVTIARSTMRRARELTAAGQAPDWLEETSVANVARVLTTDPQWFVDLDRAVLSALAQR